MWQYRELVSCPLTVVLGSFEHRKLSGYVILPLLNLRLNILVRRNNEIRYTTNIPRTEWSTRLHGICYALYSGNVDRLGPVEMAEAVSMFYGGVGIYAVLNGKVLPLSLDFVDKSRFYFYLLPLSTRCEYVKAQLADWITLQFALREGLVELLFETCQHIGESSGGACILKSNLGKLIISANELYDSSYLRVFPDNAPLRHVITVD